MCVDQGFTIISDGSVQCGVALGFLLPSCLGVDRRYCRGRGVGGGSAGMKACTFDPVMKHVCTVGLWQRPVKR